jgi:sterol desaturase/sphingolipid hydroxylase (fatty acid hydroxylase superfamily)
VENSKSSLFELNWRPTKKILKIDILHSLITSLMVTPFMKFLILAFLMKYHESLNFLNIWPSDLSFLIQIPLAILLADLLIYISHRFMHATDLGWRIHVIHHTTTKMNIWAASRTHPLNSMLVYTTEIGVLLILGIKPEVLAIWTVFMSVNGLFEHCNIDLRLGFLNRVFATSDVHRVHHSSNWENSNSNFGNTTVIWDQVFKTYNLPAEPIREQGIKMHHIPESYIDHMKAPFLLNKYKRN